MRRMIFDDRSRDEFIKFVQQIDVSKRRYIGILKVFRNNRSLNQNSLYWMWLTCCEKESETGYDKDDFHLMFKKKFLPWIIKSIDDVTVEKLASTSKINTKEFTEYLDKIQIYAASTLGVNLPEPGDAAWESFYTHYGME